MIAIYGSYWAGVGTHAPRVAQLSWFGLDVGLAQ